jgi:hypothetical protein
MPEVPDFVKCASHAEQYGDHHTASHLFADPANRRLPYHTPAACWRSAEALSDQLITGAAAERIKTAASMYGIDAEVEAVLSQAKGSIKYAYVRHNDDGTVERHLPLRHPLEVGAAVDYLQTYRDQLALRDRQKMASAVLDAVRDFSMTMPDAQKHELLKQAGQGECLTDTLKRALLARASLLGAENPYTVGLVKMAEGASSRGTREVRAKLASALDAIDRETGLAREYANGLQRPEDALFGLTICTLKQAGEQFVRLADGTVFQKEALAAIHQNAVEDWLGEETAHEVWGLNPQGVDQEKLAEVAQSLPAPAAKRFTQCAAACGIDPV